MRAAGSEQADTPGAVAECYELLTEQRDAHRWAILLLSTSSDRSAGVQKRRNSAPIGVPGPVRVSSPFSEASILRPLQRLGFG